MEPTAGVSSTPVAIFRARSVRDAASLERDALPVFSVRQLTSEGVEVLFGDGIWLLASPVDLDVPGSA